MLYEDIMDTNGNEVDIRDAHYENEELIGVLADRPSFENTSFLKCQLSDNDFEGGEFIDVTFDSCNLSNSKLKKTYFKNCKFLNCKMDGVNFGTASFKNCKFEGCSLVYGNFVASLWELTEVTDCDCKQSFFSEAVLKKPTFKNVNFTSTDFFKTKLKGIDLSDCIITNIMVSDTFSELAGMKVNVYQAAELAALLKVQIV